MKALRIENIGEFLVQLHSGASGCTVIAKTHLAKRPQLPAAWQGRGRGSTPTQATALPSPTYFSSSLLSFPPSFAPSFRGGWWDIVS